MSTDQLASVEIRCIPDNRHAIIGVQNSKRARFEIDTKKNEQNGEVSRRIPLNLVLVVDRSGSMASHNKLEFVKQAVISVLDLLHDDDVVHLVAYDDNVWNVFENARGSARQVLYSAVNGIKTGGQTNLSGGMETGANLLEKYLHPGFSKRMFVLSDGLANVGLQTKEEIMKAATKYNEKGIIIDSFGVGEGFDEKIMKGISESGCGQFFFLESADLIVPLMTKALQSVFDICGTQAQLIIRGRNNAIVTKIWGHENIALGANIGDLHFDNLRVILCDFTVSGTISEGTEVDVLDYQLKYNRPDNFDGESLIVTGTLSVTFVNDESLIQEIDPRVKTLHAVQVAAEMDDRIAQLMTNNQRGNAIKVIGEQIALLKEVEHLDDEKGMISMLIRMAENMQKRLEDNDVSQTTAAKYYGHHGHMKKCHDYKYTNHYAKK
jgi:Ca-activated chloride channel family protein